MNEEPDSPPVFVPLPMAGEPRPDAPVAGDAARPAVRIVYLRYRDPRPLEFPDRPGKLGGPIFHAAGVLLREDDAFVALGEVAFAEENAALVQRYGRDLFPAYRNILTVPKAAIVARLDVSVDLGSPVTGGPEGEGSSGQS